MWKMPIDFNVTGWKGYCHRLNALVSNYGHVARGTRFCGVLVLVKQIQGHHKIMIYCGRVPQPHPLVPTICLLTNLSKLIPSIFLQGNEYTCTSNIWICILTFSPLIRVDDLFKGVIWTIALLCVLHLLLHSSKNTCIINVSKTLKTA